MEELAIQELQSLEADILSRREFSKQEIRQLTKDLYNVRQRIRYAKEAEKQGKKQHCLMFEMFGKKRSELTAEELKHYNRVIQQRKRKKATKIG